MKEILKILLVEDEIITAMSIKSSLEKIGFRIVEIVTTGENAITSVMKNRPDMILMDIMLAGEIDGIEAAAAINSGSETDIPVIFCTAYEDRDIRERAEKTGPLGFLIKPLEMIKLKKIITGYSEKNGF